MQGRMWYARQNGINPDQMAAQEVVAGTTGHPAPYSQQNLTAGKDKDHQAIYICLIFNTHKELAMKKLSNKTSNTCKEGAGLPQPYAKMKPPNGVKVL